MVRQKERARLIYETCLGQPVRAHQWKELKAQLNAAQMPITAKNLGFVAKCKRVAPRKGIQANVLNFVAQAAIDLEGEIRGVTLKDYIYSNHPKISRDKFYRAFRGIGISYKNDGTYSISELGEVFYKLFA